MTGYLLAVDGGNTKTVALVARQDGTILGAGRAGCADIYGAGSPEAALAEIEAAATEACAGAGIGRAEIEVGAFSLAGADWPEDYALLRQALAQRGLGQRVAVYHDSIGALRAGSPDGTGVAVVLGTATAVGARTSDGRFWHTSFWQWEGAGAIDLGVAAIRLTLRSALGIDPPTALTHRLPQFFHTDSVEAMIHHLTRRDAPRSNHALLAPILLEVCEQGDLPAQQVVERLGTVVAEYALAAARQVGLQETGFWLVLSGGVLRGPAATLINRIVAHVQATQPGAVPVRSPYEPVIGALFLALDTIQAPVDEAVHAHVRATLPPDALFAT